MQSPLLPSLWTHFPRITLLEEEKNLGQEVHGLGNSLFTAFEYMVIGRKQA